VGCSPACPEDDCQAGPDEPAHVFSHSVEGVSDRCSLSSQCDDVLLRCPGSDYLAESCESANGVNVFALPSAWDEPNRPFGIASCVVLECDWEEP
jgi:hypothetical protein